MSPISQRDSFGTMEFIPCLQQAGAKGGSPACPAQTGPYKRRSIAPFILIQIFNMKDYV